MKKSIKIILLILLFFIALIAYSEIQARLFPCYHAVKQISLPPDLQGAQLELDNTLLQRKSHFFFYLPIEENSGFGSYCINDTEKSDGYIMADFRPNAFPPFNEAPLVDKTPLKITAAFRTNCSWCIDASPMLYLLLEDEKGKQWQVYAKSLSGSLRYAPNYAWLVKANGEREAFYPKKYFTPNDGLWGVE